MNNRKRSEQNIQPDNREPITSFMLSLKEHPERMVKLDLIGKRVLCLNGDKYRDKGIIIEPGNPKWYEETRYVIRLNSGRIIALKEEEFKVLY